MNLTNIIYNDVQESFSMGGPYLGSLDFNGMLSKNQFVADAEKISSDKTKIALCKYSGTTKQGIFKPRKRHFHLIVFFEKTQVFYQSIKSFDALSVESFIGNTIVFHEAFHNSTKKYQREIIFSSSNFKEISNSDL